MSEHLSPTPEHVPKIEQAERSEYTDTHHPEKSPERAEEALSSEQIETIRSDVKQEALSGKDVPIETAANERQNSPQPLVTKDLQNHMLDRTLVRVRKQLPAITRPFSRLIHNKPVDAVSSVSEKTITRPVGLLGGAFAALIGSIFSLYTAKHYGYKYNFALYIALFLAGYIIFTAIELFVLTLHRHRHGRP